MGNKRLMLSAVVVLWLLIGTVAAWQRGYFDTDEHDCGSLGSTVVTVVVGPLNYVGVNPDVECPEAPEPSQ